MPSLLESIFPNLCNIVNPNLGNIEKSKHAYDFLEKITGGQIALWTFARDRRDHNDSDLYGDHCCYAAHSVLLDGVCERRLPKESSLRIRSVVEV